MRIIKNILIIGLLVLFQGCFHDSGNSDPTTISFKIIVTGDYTAGGPPESRRLEVLDNEVSFDTSLALFSHTVADYVVDFSVNQVVLSSLGFRPTGGYEIAVEEVEEKGDYLIVKIVISQPGQDCMVTQAETSPFQFVEISSQKSVVFQERTIVTECQ